MMELSHMDIDADPDTSLVPPMVLNFGVEAETRVEVTLDEDPDKLVPPKYLLVVDPVEVDVKAFDQQARWQVLRDVSPAENQPADTLQSGTVTWKIENWSEIDQGEINSENFVIGGYKWRLLLLFGGDGCYPDHLSVYLAVENSAELRLGWSRFASVTLKVVNQLDPELTVKKRVITHQFNQDSRDVGFDKFLSIADLHHPDVGFLVNDSLIIESEVDVSRAGRKVVAYDCRKETGFVGLKNQGATCYLNSLIQTLYHLPVFRKAVYHMPTSPSDLLSESIPLALQSLFYKLQYSDTSPGTEDLTKSFGWDPSRCSMEADAHEVNLFLREKLDEEMRDTPIDGTIQQLFEGHVTNYKECIDVGYMSSLTESFYDIKLDVKGYKDVYASFDKYVEVEKLEGDNQYSTEYFGLQDARKGAKFVDFPPILQLHLQRSEYNFRTEAMMKINDRYEFPLKLDLDRENGKYLSADADRSVRNLYTLQSVLVHSGSSVETGHKFVFIRPTLSDQWYKFDDDLVTKEESKTVLEEYCGVDHEHQSHSSAYMLLYIRESQEEEILCSVEQEDIPEHLQVRFEEEEEAEWRERKKKVMI